MSNIINRLKRYKKRHNLTNEALRDRLRAAGIMVSIGSVNNWIQNNNEPSQMFRAGIENFLIIGEKIER